MKNIITSFIKYIVVSAFVFAFVFSAGCSGGSDTITPKDGYIGVIFVNHGGFATHSRHHLWDSAVQMFTYDPNHPVYGIVIWSPDNWDMVFDVEFYIKMDRKFEFAYNRLGGTDPNDDIIEAQLALIKEEVQILNDNNYSENNFTFFFDTAGWMAGENPGGFPYPRFLYYGPDGKGVGENMDYCGETDPEGPFSGCNSKRYNIDGPAERLIRKGVSKIVIVDMTVGGVRFSKTYDVVQMTKKAINDMNEKYNISIPAPIWINDHTNLMERSYPTEPSNWTATKGAPITDSNVSLDNSSNNPISEDMELALLHVEGIEIVFNGNVTDNQTGVLLLNHTINNYKQYFDPKINDTVTLNKNIKSVLLSRNPTMDPDNIVGGFHGIKELNPENNLTEKTREMRGQDLGHAWLYQTDKEMPGDEWGYRYWDALEYLKNRGVKHIVVAFPQIVNSSFLELVETHCQIAIEIGTKTWLKWDTKDFVTFPGVGHPFSDYWGVWVDTTCGPDDYNTTGTYDCCFTMGGCIDGRPYPPLRQAPLGTRTDSFEPSLAFDLSEYGHLGYDQNSGAPDPNNPVQDQYTGTWAVWETINEDPRLGKILARHILDVLTK